MTNLYYYFNDKKLSIQVTDKTLQVTPYTFQPNGTMWENASLLQFFKSIKNEKINIADIGAQSGLYSLYAKFLDKTTFYSFEPFTTTYDLLVDNLALNNITNVKPYNIGLSDTSGVSVLNTCITHNGLHTMGTNVQRFDDIKQVEIQTQTLDNMFYHKNIPVHYIKIDTEGWEYNILKGGELSIKKYKPIIQLEWNITNMNQCNINEDDLKKLLDNYGYYEKSMVEEEKLFFPYLGRPLIPEICTHVKLDVGLSYSAPQSQNWLKSEPNLMVFGFEPNPEAVSSILSGNIQKRDPGHGEPLNNIFIDDGRFHLIPVALSNVDQVENMSFYINNNDCGTSSLFNHDQNYLGSIKKIIDVPVYSLLMFFDNFPWDRFNYIDYIKIDAQGSDLNILKSMGHYLSERVVYVTAEPDGYQYIGASDCNNTNITTYMLSHNFTQVNHPNTQDPTFLNNKFSHLSHIYINQY